ncbi:site-specific integrase [Nocardioides sp. 31GB23]|uniref:tyrosine-type recombinase/integrase n=1 Tax=Nocardioides sp. 31GB23 TaxID=3156065 RepID=UPI0032AF564B
MSRTAQKRRPFGSTRKLPSGRVQARYACPTCKATHPGHITFERAKDADAWLATVRAAIVQERYACPAKQPAATDPDDRAAQPFAEYADAWLAARTLRERTRLLYRSILDRELVPAFGATPLEQITRAQVRQWHTALPADRPTGNAHAYALLRTILGAAVDAEVLDTNPATIKGAGQTKRSRHVEPATVPELDTIAAAMPEPYGLAVLLAGWCALRYGELVELRRRDVSNDGAVVRVRRTMNYRDGRLWIGPPKSVAGTRDVSVPPHLQPALVQHLEKRAQPGKDGLVFPSRRSVPVACPCGYSGCVGGHLMATTFHRWFVTARAAADRTDLRVHDLRHTGLTLAAHAGATLPDLMKRAGHSSVDAAQVYMHAASGRDAEIAARMSQLVGQ